MAKYLVSTLDPPDWRFGHWGPYLHGSNLYTLVTGQVLSSEYVTVMKSTDAGVTWTEMDAANRKLLANQERSSASMYVFSNTIRVYYANSGGFVAVADFSMATDTWGAEDASTAAMFATGEAFGGVDGVRRSDGSDVIIYQGPDVGGWGQCHYLVRSGVGSWSAPGALGSGGTITVGVALGASDRTSIFFWDQGTGIKHKSLSSANVIGLETFATSDLIQSFTGYPFGKPLVISGEIYLPYVTEDVAFGVPTLRVEIGTDEAVPIWTTTEPDNTRATSYGGVTDYSWGSMVDVGGVPWIVFIGFDLNSSFPTPIYANRYVASAWGLSSEVLAPDTETYYGLSAWSLGTDVGVVFQYDGDTYYAALTLDPATPAADTVYARGGTFG
jgi:hypothetical protein